MGYIWLISTLNLRDVFSYIISLCAKFAKKLPTLLLLFSDQKSPKASFTLFYHSDQTKLSFFFPNLNAPFFAFRNHQEPITSSKPVLPLHVKNPFEGFLRKVIFNGSKIGLIESYDGF